MKNGTKRINAIQVMAKMRSMLALLFFLYLGTSGAWATLTKTGEFYQISTAEDWGDFATLVVNEPAAKAQLTGDITVNTMVGTSAVPYQGTFDGQGHS